MATRVTVRTAMVVLALSLAAWLALAILAVAVPSFR
jgi:hypothetical protein